MDQMADQVTSGFSFTFAYGKIEATRGLALDSRLAEAGMMPKRSET